MVEEEEIPSKLPKLPGELGWLGRGEVGGGEVEGGEVVEMVEVVVVVGEGFQRAHLCNVARPDPPW